MNCKLCIASFDHQAHIPKVLPCCGKSICTFCCTKLDSSSSNKCPYCRKSLPSPFKDLTKNTNLLENIPECISTTCKTHNKLNEMFCESCEVELCTKCIKNHSGSGHDINNIETFFANIQTQMTDYRDWMNKALTKSDQYDKALYNSQAYLKKEVNELFENLIKNIRIHQEKAMKDIEERFKATDIKTFYFQDDIDILKLVQECKDFINPETANIKLPQKVQFLKKNRLKVLMEWSNRNDSESLSQILNKTKVHFKKDCINPFKLVVHDEPILIADKVEGIQSKSEDVVIGIIEQVKLNIQKQHDMTGKSQSSMSEQSNSSKNTQSQGIFRIVRIIKDKYNKI